MTIANASNHSVDTVIIPTAGSVPFHCYASGLWSLSTTAPLVLLIHGAGGSHQHFDTMIPVLMNAGYRTLTCDLRLHGQSQPDKSIAQTCRLDFQQMICDLKQALIWITRHYPAKQGKPVDLVLCGLSMGGMLCQDFLRTTTSKEFENLGYSPLALVAMGCGSVAMDHPRIEWMDAYQDMLFGESDMAVPRAAIGLSAQRPQSIVDAQKAMQCVSDEALFQCLQACAKSLQSAQQPVAKVPHLLIRGQEDTHTDAVMKAWKTVILEHGVHCELIHIPEAGHLVTLDAGVQVAEFILQFVGDK